MKEEGQEGVQERFQLQPQSGEEVGKEVEKSLLLAQWYHHIRIHLVPRARGKLKQALEWNQDQLDELSNLVRPTATKET